MPNFSIYSKNPVFGPFLVHFPSFWGKKVFQENPALSRTASYGFLATCQNLEKTKDTIPRKRPERGPKDGRKDGRKDRPYFIRALRLTPGLQKRLWHRCFPMNFAKFLKTPLGDCFCVYNLKFSFVSRFSRYQWKMQPSRSGTRIGYRI